MSKELLPNAVGVDDLFPAAYGDLRRMAARRLGGRVDHPTLQPTALVHELFVRMVGNRGAQFADRTHFFAVAARAMRAILADRARARAADKRGPGLTISLVDVEQAADSRAAGILELETALVRLEALDPRQARVVELRYFGGLTIPETAEVLGISPMTVKREWRIAKAWLRRALEGDQTGPGPKIRRLIRKSGPGPVTNR